MNKTAKIGSTLILIGIILTFLLTGIALIMSSVVLYFAIKAGELVLWLIFGFAMFLAVTGFLIGSLKIWARNMIKNPEEAKKGGLIAMITGILYGPDIFSIIGGIMALSDSK